MNVIFNGVSLGEHCLISDVVRPILGRTANTQKRGGSDGAALLNSSLDELKISFILWPNLEMCDDLRSAAREIASVLYVNEPAPLMFTDDGGLYYMVVPNEEVSVVEYSDALSISCSFIATDPIMYGEQNTVTVPSGGSVTFEVGGTYKTAPVITASAVRDGESLVWGLRLDEGDYIHIATGSSQNRLIAIDCGSRTMTLSGNATIPTLDSDWLELEPGEHTLRMDNGAGAATVTWRERWL